jgi:hypothetical protein
LSFNNFELDDQSLNFNNDSSHDQHKIKCYVTNDIILLNKNVNVNANFTACQTFLPQRVVLCGIYQLFIYHFLEHQHQPAAVSTMKSMHQMIAADNNSFLRTLHNQDVF